jgi:hypothetical protein
MIAPTNEAARDHAGRRLVARHVIASAFFCHN